MVNQLFFDVEEGNIEQIWSKFCEVRAWSSLAVEKALFKKAPLFLQDNLKGREIVFFSSAELRITWLVEGL